MYMRAFAEAWPEAEIVQQAVGQLPWGHNLVLLTRLKDPGRRLAYAQSAIAHGWSRNVLNIHIETGLLERKGAAVTNFDARLPRPHSDLACRAAIKMGVARQSGWNSDPSLSLGGGRSPSVSSSLEKAAQAARSARSWSGAVAGAGPDSAGAFSSATFPRRSLAGRRPNSCSMRSRSRASSSAICCCRRAASR